MIEYFASNLWQAWAIMALICLILELTSGDFFFCCFVAHPTMQSANRIMHSFFIIYKMLIFF